MDFNKRFLLILSAVLLLVLAYFFLGSAQQQENVVFGVNFSKKHAQELGLDWKKVYSGLLYDLKVKYIKLLTFWDLVEPQKDEFFFEDLDWQIEQAEHRNAEVIMVIGMKTGSWPECHVPGWANGLGKQQQQEEILGLIEIIVQKYKDKSVITTWGVENEPLFYFGDCPWKDKAFLKQEIALVKSLDPGRPVMVSDSGELSMWFEAAKLGDVVGTTMYRKAWWKEGSMYVDYPFPPVMYFRKARLIKTIFNKEVMNVELQAEPWCQSLIQDCSLEEQDKTMNPERFEQMIEFARNSGLNKFYLWGGEWWFWLKENYQNVDIWEQARTLF